MSTVQRGARRSKGRSGSSDEGDPVSPKRRSLLGSIETVPIDLLILFPGNPRKGNVDAILHSLEVNQQYRALVVQKSTEHVLVGNHTLRAAKRLGWTEIDVTYVDVNDEQAVRIMLSDNRTQDLAGYDTEALGRMLDRMEDPTMGTGYEAADVSSILESLSSLEPVDLTSVLHPGVANSMSASVLSEAGVDGAGDAIFGDELDASTDGVPADRVAKEADGLADADDSTAGVFQLKEDLNFSSAHPWGIPELRADMLVAKLPAKFDTWAGSATRDDPRQQDPDFWWLYNYGIDSTSGMADVKRIILGFYTHDDYFTTWWDYPARHVGKMLNAGVRSAIMPNFSQWSDDPKTVQLWALYRSRWLARYMQEAGVKVVPDLNWPGHDRAWLDDFVLPGIPSPCPIISMELQTYDTSEAKNVESDIRYVVSKLKPGTLLVYSGESTRDWVGGFGMPTKVAWLPNRLIALGRHQREQKKLKDKSGSL